MQKLFSFIFLCCLLCRMNNAAAQPGDKVYKEVLKLKAQGADTIIRLQTPGGFPFAGDTLPGFGFSPHVYDVEYLIYKQGSKIYARKFVSNCSAGCNEMLQSVSNRIVISEDSLFRFLHHSANRMAGETIYPYIYKVTDTFATMERYNTARADHPTLYFLGIYITNNDDMAKLVNMNDMERYLYDNENENLNYESNIHTRIAGFLELLQRRIVLFDRQFTFPQPVKAKKK